jgi:hypothetical protein
MSKDEKIKMLMSLNNEDDGPDDHMEGGDPFKTPVKGASMKARPQTTATKNRMSMSPARPSSPGSPGTTIKKSKKD